MRKYIYIFIIVFVTLRISAQPNSKRDKIDELRVAFISKKVILTTLESQQFWPLYNEYNDKLDLLKRTFRQTYLKNLNPETLTEKEADTYLNAEISLKQKEVDLTKEYFEKYKKVIPVKKIALIKIAENDFKKELIKNIKGSTPE